MDAFDEGALVDQRTPHALAEAAPVSQARPQVRAQGLSRMFDDAALAARLERLRRFSKRVRTSEYHLTNACNIRCNGCWFFEYGFEKTGRENTSLEMLAAHIEREKARGVNAALLIGGEPTLYLKRVAKYVEAMEFVSISTNGLKPLPRQGFENVTVFVSLFGGGPLDDDLRAITPSGRRFDGLFDTSLRNYRDDPRATFVYALSDQGIDYIEDAVRQIADNGNRVTFNYYTAYGAETPMNVREGALLEKALEVRAKYPDVVICTEYYIETLITGRAHWRELRLRDLPEHQRRPSGPPGAPRPGPQVAAVVQHLRARSEDDQFLLHVRTLRRVSRQPGRLQLAHAFGGQVLAQQGPGRDLDRHGRRLLEAIHMVALSPGLTGAGRSASTVTTLWDLVEDAAQRFAARRFIAPFERGSPSVSYAELADFTRGLRAVFDERAIPEAAVVAVVLPNSTLMALLFIAIPAAGRRYLPMHPTQAAPEREYMLDVTGARDALPAPWRRRQPGVLAVWPQGSSDAGRRRVHPRDHRPRPGLRRRTWPEPDAVKRGGDRLHLRLVRPAEGG